MSRTVLLATVGALALGLAVLLIVRKDTRRKTRRTQSWALLLFGLCGAGTLGGWRDQIAAKMATATAQETAVWVGVAVPYLLALAVVLWWYMDMNFNGFFRQLRAGGRGTSKALVTADDDGGAGSRSRIGTLLKTQGSKCRWYTPLLGMFVMPCLAICPVVGGVPDGLRNGLVRLLFGLGAHLSGA